MHANDVQPGRASGLWLKVGAIVALGFIVYSPAMRGGWLWDDRADILENPLLRSGIGLKKIWWEPTRLFDFYPIKYSVQWIQWQLWGNQPLGYHLTNIALHIIGALLFWRILRRLGVSAAWLGGLLFVVHPLTVESVAWCAELKNTLALPPLLLALDAFISFDESGRRSRLFAASGWFVFTMLCKSSCVMLPVTLLLYAWWRRGKLAWRDLFAAAPFFVISLGFGLITVWFQHHRGIGEETFSIGGPAAHVALAGTSEAFYLWKSIFPFDLMPIYRRWSIEPPTIALFLPYVGLGLVCASCWRHRVSWGKHVLLGLGWFTLHLVPFVGFVPISYMRFSWVADHIAYLPLLGLIGLGTAGFGHAWGASKKMRPALAAAVAGMVAVSSCATYRQNGYYRTEETFWAEAAHRNPDAWMAHNNLGVLLDQRGQTAEAEAHLRTALRLKPDYPDAHKNLADLLGRTGRREEAASHYEQALQLKPSFAGAHNNLGTLLGDLGRVDAAAEQYRLALKYNSEMPEAYNNLGLILRDQGHLPEAIALLQVAIALDADYFEGHANLAIALRRAGRTNDSIGEYQKAVALRPNSAEIRYNLANALRDAGRHDEAIASYEEALRLKPGFAVAHQNIVISLHAVGREAEARVHYAKARQLMPDLPEWPY